MGGGLGSVMRGLDPRIHGRSTNKNERILRTKHIVKTNSKHIDGLVKFTKELLEHSGAH